MEPSANKNPRDWPDEQRACFAFCAVCQGPDETKQIDRLAER